MDGGGILYGGNGAGGMRGENLVGRNGFEVKVVGGGASKGGGGGGWVSKGAGGRK